MGSLLRRTWLIMALALAPALADTRLASWQKVQDALDQGLPKSAIVALEPVIASAVADSSWAEAVKAIGMRIALEGHIQGNKPEEKIRRLQSEIDSHPPPMRALLETILAEWYWQYFQKYRGRFVQRSQLAGPAGPDILTWDLSRILAEIDVHFTRALSDEKTLQSMPIGAFDELLEPGNMPDDYRPTLFDFVAHEALKFYTAGEQVGAAAEDAFVLEAAGPIFAPAADFMRWQPAAADSSSPTRATIRVFQRLLEFHQKDADRSAFAEVDLERLIFGFNKALGEEKHAGYTAALELFVAEHDDHEVAARALAHWARAELQADDPPKAHALALRGWTMSPGSPGGGMCFNILQEIGMKSVAIETERVWNEPLPVIRVRYRNITRVFFRAVPYEFESWLATHRGHSEWVDASERDDLLGRVPALQWHADLPPTADYRERTLERPAPGGLAPGFYMIVVGADSAFTTVENQISAAPVWVSDLALVVRQRPAVIDGFVLDARTGEPVPGATIRSWSRTDKGSWERGAEATADGDGVFQIVPTGGHGLLVAQHGEHRLSTPQEHGVARPTEVSSQDRTVLFSDRSLYRPGQTIYYKGIQIRFDPNTNDYRTLAGARVTIVFSDANGQEIARRAHTCNDYGSFEGTFTAPRDRLLGWMRLSSGHGSLHVSVEEYKRPKFEVALEAPKLAPRLGDEVAVPGAATTYAGSPVGDAKVQWRVERTARFPVWCWWRSGGYDAGGTGPQRIAHGVTTTAADGGFEIRFVAKPDPGIPAQDEPTFEYRITAEVTDPAGETRTDERRVRVGYTALQASIAVHEWQTPDTPVELGIETRSVDGEARPARGRMRIYRLQQPERPVRAGPEAAWLWRSRARGVPVHADPAPETWPLGKLAASRTFRTDRTGQARIQVALATGIYRVVLETRDRFGAPVQAMATVRVVEPRACRYPVRVAAHLTAPRWAAEPGERFVALWGTGYDSGRACVEIEHRGKLLRRYWTPPGCTQHVIEQSVDEELRGGFTLRVTFVRENRAYLEERIVAVPWSNKRLTIRWESFRSKLAPGQKETWTAVVRGPGAERAAVEMVAALYDAALDAYSPHSWPQGFDVFRHEPGWVQATFMNSTVGFRPLFGNWRRAYCGDGVYHRTFAPGILDDTWSYSAISQGMSDRKGGIPGTLMGRVFDKESGQPLVFANVVVVGTHWGANARQGGEFRISTLPPGPYSVRASFVGYNPLTLPVWVASAKTVTLEFGLAKGLGTMLETVRVGSARAVDVRASDVRHVHAGAGPMALPAESVSEAMALNTGVVVMGGELHARGGRSDPRELRLEQVVARRNLQETAFFFPCLRSDSTGVVRIEFTMPEGLTEWRFLGFAHDRELRSGFLEDRAVTSKDLQVEPNPPRFVREGDAIELTVKVTNRTSRRQTGRVGLRLADAKTLQGMDAALGNALPERDFDVPGNETRTYAWRLVVPDGCGFLTYKAVGASARTSDGEEGFLPVLSRRILLTESLPLPVRGPQTKQFEFAKLLAADSSSTLRHQSLTVQMVSQPAWYAVMALPYLMEYPHQCSEQTFNRLYANALARHIATSRPEIRRIFDLWKETPTLESPLEKNQDLKSVLLEETPWVRQAQAESQARHNVGLLFEGNRLDAEVQRAARTLSEMQLADGMWPWFPGGLSNSYITLYITTGFGRLRHLGVRVDVSLAVKALRGLDQWMDDQYDEVVRLERQASNNLRPTVALYLYGRSFFLKDSPVAAEHREAFDYWIRQARKYWLALGSRQSQAHVALGLSRLGDEKVPRAILKSLVEHSVSDEELGMYWRDLERSWWWYRAPIETQAMMIEALAEVARDSMAVEACKVWLLKQKQTQDWKTTKATADAVYALLLRGDDLLASRELVRVALGGQTIEPEAVEAGTGFYEERFTGAEIRSDMGRVTVSKSDRGVSWGSLHWQYLEDMSKVAPYEGTPLMLRKAMLVKRVTAQGSVLEPVAGPLAVGDELVTRIELRTDRDMEYVHLTDQRGSGTEPVNVLSHYKYQDGLAYYESTRDAASHFFIDYLPKGTYVFEYSCRAQHRGEYQTGIASIQCMYAPEFNGHSASLVLQVQ